VLPVRGPFQKKVKNYYVTEEDADSKVTLRGASAGTSDRVAKMISSELGPGPFYRNESFNFQMNPCGLCMEILTDRDGAAD